MTILFYTLIRLVQLRGRTVDCIASAKVITAAESDELTNLHSKLANSHPRLTLPSSGTGKGGKPESGETGGLFAHPRSRKRRAQGRHVA